MVKLSNIFILYIHDISLGLSLYFDILNDSDLPNQSNTIQDFYHSRKDREESFVRPSKNGYRASERVDCLVVIVGVK